MVKGAIGMSSKTKFGNRGMEPDPPPPQKEQPPRKGLFTLRQFGMFATGFAIVIGLTLVNHMGMKAFGKRMHDRFTERVAPSSSIGADKIAELKGNVSGSAGEAFTQCSHETQQMRLPTEKSREIDRHIGIFSGETALLRSSYFLNCVSRKDPRIFCEPGSRSFLVAGINEYFDLHRQMAEEWKLARNEHGAFRIMHSLPKTDAQVKALNLPSKTFSPLVLETIAKLASAGILSRSDFGGFLGFGTPAPISDAIAKAGEPRDVCQARSG